MKTISFSLGALLILSVLAACQVGAVAPVLSHTDALTTSAGSASSASGGPVSTVVAPAETATPVLEAPPVPQAPTTPTAAPTQLPAAVNDASSSQASGGAVTTTPKTCRDVAAFYGDVTIPDGEFFRAGDRFTKTWRFRNAGECAWTPAYSLVFYGGEIMNAPLAVPLTAPVAPGEQVDLSINMQAPNRGGEHTGNWEFADPAGSHFGVGSGGNDRFWVTINVSFVDNQGAAVPAGPLVSPGFLPFASAAIPAGCAGKQEHAFETQVIALINQARQENGLPPLQENSQVNAAALGHSIDMACNNFLNHTGSDGSTWYDRLRAQDYIYNDARENIYAGDPGYGGDPQGAFNWWMNSQVHRDNILNPQATEIGVGYVANPQSEFGGYFTVVFTRP